MKTEPHVLILDTGPLWELVLYQSVHTLGFGKLRPELSHLLNDNYHGRLSRFISGFQNRTTTPQVIAEISHKVRQTEKRGQGDIWGLVFREFSEMGLDERLIKLLEMPEEWVAQFGAVDASLLKLSFTYAPGVPLVLSIDSSLIAECKRSQVAAKDLWEVIAAEAL